MKKTITLTLLSLFMFIAASAQTKDTLRVLCLGNSFTYVESAHQKLADLAASEGHHIVMKAIYVGGHTFNRHLNDIVSIRAIETGGYDCVFLQDQSQMQARYAQNPKRWKLAKQDTKELADRIREYSPQAKIWLECTWSYTQGNCGGFGSLAEFDRLLDKGSRAFAKMIKSEVSPIGAAFAKCRAERQDINLYDKDDKHQSAYGSYLKACINFQMLYHESFDEKASDCGLDHDKCVYLRSLAERVAKEWKK